MTSGRRIAAEPITGDPSIEYCAGLVDAGTYVVLGAGTLLRVSSEPDIDAKGGSPAAPPEPLRLVKLSDDPWIPITRARRLAANRDIPIGF